MFQTRRHAPIATLPLYSPETALVLPVNLAASTVFARGTVLGEVSASATAVHTLTTTGTPTGGSQTWRFLDPITGVTSDFAILFNSTIAQSQASIRAAIGNSDVTVSSASSAAQPGAAHVFTYSGRYATVPIALPTLVTNALTGGSSPVGAFTGTAGVSANTYGTYADAGSGGLDTARCVLMYDCATDSAGRITLGSSAVGGPHGETFEDTPAYFTGFFATADLTGLTAAAVADLGRMISGTYAAGVLSMS